MMGHSICVAPTSSAGILICPSFTYTKGNLYSEEYALLKSLSNAGCHVDYAFQVNFDPQSKVVP